jgi:hypothetical protein
MNERIRELSQQVGLPMGLSEPQWHYEPSVYQLAELIVRECHNVIFESTGPRSALNILEHFGFGE